MEKHCRSIFNHFTAACVKKENTNYSTILLRFLYEG